MMLFFVSLSFFNCQNEDLNEIESLSLEERVANLNDLSNDVMIFFKEYNKKEKNKSKFSKNETNKLLNPIINKTRKILAHLGLTKSDLEKVSGENVNSVYAVFGIALVAKHKSNLNTKETNLFSREKGAWECLKEALGVDAIAAFAESAYALYGGEVAAGWAVDGAAAAAFRSAGLSAAKSAIKRFAGGLGAIIVIAEFTICMLD